MLEIKNVSIKSKKDGFTFVNNLSCILNQGDKCAIIGEEGSGKSTLLKHIVNHALTPYADVDGTITVNGKIGYLEQDIKSSWKDHSVEHYFLLDHPDDAIDYSHYERLKYLSKVLKDVALKEESLDLNKTVSMFSGGEVVKLGLAKLLLKDSDILLLDEPSNDLDFETILFLEAFIENQNKPVLFISHDERLLENTATSLIHLTRVNKHQKAVSYFEKMSYLDYKNYRLKQDEHETMVIKKTKAEHEKKVARFRQIYERVEHAQNQAVRNPSTARLLAKKMKQLKAAEKRYEKDESQIAPIPEPTKPITLLFDEGIKVPKGKKVLDYSAEALTINDRLLSGPIHLLLKGPIRVVITGKNGCGKTTLFKKLYNHLNKTSDLKVGYMPQSYDMLEHNHTVLSFLEADHDKTVEARVRKMLGSIGFEREEMLAKTKDLSGGQKAKLYLLKLVLNQSEIILLDEPTRNISPLNAKEIYHLINSFGGAVIAITHDRTFIESCFDALYVLSEKGLTKQ